ncbi:MAG: hypothetical protein LC623_01510 [Halobacteriales archaeon]|nr:hypothetical protein [Halobacteriales archaeon]
MRFALCLLAAALAALALAPAATGKVDNPLPNGCPKPPEECASNYLEVAAGSDSAPPPTTVRAEADFNVNGVRGHARIVADRVGINEDGELTVHEDDEGWLNVTLDDDGSGNGTAAVRLTVSATEGLEWMGPADVNATVNFTHSDQASFPFRIVEGRAHGDPIRLTFSLLVQSAQGNSSATYNDVGVRFKDVPGGANAFSIPAAPAASVALLLVGAAALRRRRAA